MRDSLAAIAAHFRGSAERFRLMRSPFNARLATGCADDADLLELALLAAPGQPPCHLLFGVVHDLLLGEPSTPLARYYPSIADNPRPLDQMFPAFRAFCREHRHEVSAMMRSRTVQFTTAERAALVVPAMAEIARMTGEPLSLVEVGASAGVLTLFDRYRYDYGAAGFCGSPDGPLVSGCSFRAMPPLPAAPPRIGRRVAIDLQPIDPREARERRWLEALLPPDWPEERRQLRVVLDFCALHTFEVRTGDALDIVPHLLRELADPICVLHAHCLYQWSPPLSEAFDGILREASRHRTIHRLGMEFAGPELAWVADPAADGDPVLSYEMALTVYHHGERQTRRLAVYDGFGRQAVWLQSPAASHPSGG